MDRSHFINPGRSETGNPKLGMHLAKQASLVLSIQVVDSRQVPTKPVLQLHEWLEHHRKPHLIVATKSDKLSNSELPKHIERLARAQE